MTEQEELREFWEWCGCRKVFPLRSRWYLKYPNGSEHYLDPPIDLNNLFKYGVPRVLEEHSLVETYSFKQDSGLYYSETGIWDRDESKGDVLKGKRIAVAFAQGFNLEEVNVQALYQVLRKVWKEEGI